MRGDPRLAAEVLEREFLEQRARLLEVAAFLDRLDRSPGASAAKEDFRYRAVTQMVAVIHSGRRNRTEELLVLLSDPSTEITADRFPPGKAVGAWRGLR